MFGHVELMQACLLVFDTMLNQGDMFTCSIDRDRINRSIDHPLIKTN